MGVNGSKESPADKSRRQAMDQVKKYILANIDKNAATGHCSVSINLVPNTVEPPREWIEKLGYTLTINETGNRRTWIISWKEPPQRAAWEKETPN